VGSLTDIVLRHYAYVSEGQLERDREIMSPDVVTVEPGAGRIDGIDAFIGFEEGFHRAFPDGRLESRGAVESGDMVIAEGVFTGTHTGPLEGPAGTVAPTGKRLELPFCDVFRIVDGQIVEHRVYYDQMAFLGQLGLVGG
jgi:predicted ester cyclase